MKAFLSFFKMQAKWKNSYHLNGVLAITFTQNQKWKENLGISADADRLLQNLKHFQQASTIFQALKVWVVSY